MLVLLVVMFDLVHSRALILRPLVGLLKVEFLKFTVKLEESRASKAGHT